MSDYSKLFILSRDGRTPLLNLINSAKSTICITIYQIYDNVIQDALVASAVRGVKIRVIYSSNPFNESGKKILESEEKFFLSHQNIQAVPSSKIFFFTHEKSMIVDSEVISILTLNLVSDGSYDTFTEAREFGIVTNVQADVSTLINQFELDWANATLNNKDLFPKTEPGTRLFFSPSSISDPRNSYNVIINLLSSAKKNIAIYTEVFGNSRTESHRDFTDVLNELAEKGIKIRIISQILIHGMQHLHSSIKIIQPSHGFKPYFHAKSIIIDDVAATVMSVNLDHSSIFCEREAGIVITDLNIVTELSTQFDDDWRILLEHLDKSHN